MKKLTAIVSLLVLSACAAGPQPVASNDAKDFPTLIKQAEAAVKKSGDVGSQWRDAELFIGQAKMAAANGDMEKAMKLAIQAKRQGELGYQQAQEQKNAKPWLF